MADRLDQLVREAFDRLLVRTATLGASTDVFEIFDDAADHPAFKNDCGPSFDRGFIEGVAAVLDVTAIELLDELRRGGESSS